MSLLYPGVQGQKFKPFSKIDLSDAESCFSDMLNMIESSKFLAVRDGLFVNGRLSRILLTFKFLIACTIGVELFIREENLFVISIGLVLASCFLRRDERRGINQLCWPSDEIDLLVVVSLYFTLHLYFGNVVNVPFSKQSTRRWRSFDFARVVSGCYPNLPVRTFSVDKPFLVRFLNIFALKVFSCEIPIK